MRTEFRPQFPLDAETLSPAQREIFDMGDRVLGSAEVEVHILDDDSATARAANLDLRLAKAIDPTVHYYQAVAIQGRLKGENNQPSYDRDFVESAVGSETRDSITSKGWLRRVYQGSYRAAVRTNTALAAGELEVSKDFTIMRKAAQLMVSNTSGEIFYAEVEQASMDGELVVGDESHAFTTADVSTGVSFYMDSPDNPRRRNAMSTHQPEVYSWGESRGDPLSPLLLPGQEFPRLGLRVEEFPLVMGAIARQQFDQVI